MNREPLTPSLVFLITLLGSFFVSIIFEQADWLHYFMISFSIYSILTLVIPLTTKSTTSLNNSLWGDSYLPFVSILIPAKNEEKVISQTLYSAASINYLKNGKPNFEIIVINDGSTDATGTIIEDLSHKIPNLKILHRQAGISKGKSSALNAGLSLSQGEIIVVFDADTRIEPAFLKMSIPLLADKAIGGVQGRVEIYNPNINLVTMLQRNEFTFFNHLVQCSKDAMGGLTGLGGNGQLVKRLVLDEIGRWNELSLTEDFDLTIRMYFHGYKVRYAPDAIVWQEAVESWPLLLRQRTRWGQGLLQCFFDYFSQVLKTPANIIKKLDALYTLARVLIPFGILEGYVLYFLVTSDLAYFDSTFPSLLFIFLPLLMFGVMFWAITKESNYRGAEAVFHVFSYWLYSFIWVLVIPVSFINHLQTNNSVYWDKTEHKGLAAEAAKMKPNTNVSHLYIS